MAKKTAGEVSVMAGSTRLTLRLDIDGMQQIEDYFDKSILEFAEGFSGKQKPRVSDISIMFAVMTGFDISDAEERARASDLLLKKVGLMEGVKAATECMTATLMPDLGAEVGNGKPTPAKKPAKKTPKRQ